MLLIQHFILSLGRGPAKTTPNYVKGTGRGYIAIFSRVCQGYRPRGSWVVLGSRDKKLRPSLRNPEETTLVPKQMDWKHWELN